MENRKKLEANDPVSPEGDLGSRNERIGFFSGTSDEDVLGIIDTYFDFFSLLAEKQSHFFNIQHPTSISRPLVIFYLNLGRRPLSERNKGS